MRFHLSALFLAALAGATSLSTAGKAASQGSDMGVASIEATASGNGVRFVGRVLALSEGRFDARMTIEKTGTSGRTSTSQGGAVTLVAGASADIATTTLSLAPGDQVSIDLVLSTDGQAVASSRLVIGPR